MPSVSGEECFHPLVYSLCTFLPISLREASATPIPTYRLENRMERGRRAREGKRNGTAETTRAKWASGRTGDQMRGRSGGLKTSGLLCETEAKGGCRDALTLPPALVDSSSALDFPSRRHESDIKSVIALQASLADIPTTDTQLYWTDFFVSQRTCARVFSLFSFQIFLFFIF